MNLIIVALQELLCNIQDVHCTNIIPSGCIPCSAIRFTTSCAAVERGNHKDLLSQCFLSVVFFLLHLGLRTCHGGEACVSQ